MVGKPTPTKKEIEQWLNSQITNMKTYDPRDDMEDGEHIFGAVSRKRQKEQQNAIVKEIKRLLVDAIFEEEVLK